MLDDANISKNGENKIDLSIKAVVSKEYYDSVVNQNKKSEISVGVICVPCSEIEDEEFEISFNSVSEIENKTIYESEINTAESEENNGFTATIENIEVADYGKTFAAVGYIKIASDKEIEGAKIYDGANYIYSDSKIYSVYSCAYNLLAVQKTENEIAQQILLSQVKVKGKSARNLTVEPVFEDYSPYSLIQNTDGSVTLYSDLGKPSEIIYNDVTYTEGFYTDDFTFNVVYGKNFTITNEQIITLIKDADMTGFVSYLGNYGLNNYVDVSFKGKNLPEIVFFDGIIIDSKNGISYNGNDFTVYLSDETDYKYTIGLIDDDGTIKLDAYLYKDGEQVEEIKHLEKQLNVSSDLLTVGMVSAKATLNKTVFRWTVPHGYLPIYNHKTVYSFGYSSNAGNNYVQPASGVDTYQDYIDAGLNVYYLTGAAGLGYNDNTAASGWKRPTETWTQYLLKGYYNKAANVCDKIIFTDYYFYRMIETYYDGRTDGGKLIGTSQYDMFKTQEDFEQAVKDRLSLYYNAKNFYGLILRDEPEYIHFTTYGLVYRAIKKAAAELGMPYIYIHCNLLAMTVPDKEERLDPSYTQTHDAKDAFTKYLTNFITATGCDRLSIDEYPFRSTGFRTGYYSGLQVFRDVCNAYGVKMTCCMQATVQVGNSPFAKVSKGDMYMQIYSVLGFGVETIAFYTYSQGTGNQTDTGCLINNKGEKNDIYYYVQEVMKGVHKTADYLLNYKFQGCKILTQTGSYNGNYLDIGVAGYPGVRQLSSFAKLKSVKVDDDLGLVTELKDETNGLYMYMLQNIIAQYYIDKGLEDGTVKFTVDLGDTTSIAVIENGNINYLTVKDGKYVKTLQNGRAVFIIPLN